MSKALWVLVSTDEYELPLAVADTSKELAEMIGVSESSVRGIWNKYKNGTYKSSRYRKVKVDEQ